MDVVNIWYATILFLSVVGLLSLFCPQQFLKISHLASKRVHSVQLPSVDKPHFIDQKIYRFHRTAGASILLLSSVTLYLVLFEIGDEPILQRSIETGEVLEGWLLEVALIIATLASILGLVFGLIVMLRPSLLKALESWGNRWLSLPEDVLGKELGRQLDTWVTENTRLFGGFVLFISVLLWAFIFTGN